jgi:hypothetical protein
MGESDHAGEAEGPAAALDGMDRAEDRMHGVVGAGIGFQRRLVAVRAFDAFGTLLEIGALEVVECGDGHPASRTRG